MSRKTNVPIKAIASLLAVAVVFLAVITGMTKGTKADAGRVKIISFERTSPAYETRVNAGTAWADLGLPAELRAVCEIAGLETVEDETTTERAAEAEITAEKGFRQTEPSAEDAGRYGYAAPGDEARLRESNRLVIYTLYDEDGSEAYRIHGTHDGENEGFYACDENGNITGFARNIPVTWNGIYDSYMPGEYTLTARIEDYSYDGAMPAAVITVEPAAGNGRISGALPAEITDSSKFAADPSADAPHMAYSGIIGLAEGQSVENINAGPIMRAPVITNNTGLLASLGKLKVDDSTGFIKSEDWVVVKIHGSGDDKAIMLARKGGGNLGRFGGSNSYNGSELQQFYTGYYIGWESPLKDLALVPALGDHTNPSSVSNPKVPLELASATTQTTDIVFAMSRQDMVAWNNNSTTPVRDKIRNNWPRTDQSSHMWLRTKGTGTSFVWELNNTGPQGYIADAAQSSGNINRVPAVWVKAADVWREVTVHCIDTDGNPVVPPYSKTYQVPYDASIELEASDIPAIAGYTFTSTWKLGSANAASNPLPASVSNVRTDTDIYLVYEKTTTDLMVKVHFIDKATGNPIGSPTSRTYFVPSGGAFTLPGPDVQDIMGYEYKGWKNGVSGAANTTLPVTVSNVTSNTDIYLLYEKTATNEKNAYINGSPAAQNGAQGNPALVKLEDEIKYTITAFNQKKPGASGAKYDILFVLDWSQSMDIGWMYGEGANTRTARQYELDVMLDMFDFVSDNYPNSRVAVMAMNSTGFHGDLARTYLQYDTAFLTPSQYKNGGKAAMEIAFTETWENPTEDPATFLNAAVYKMQGMAVSLGNNAGGQKQVIPRAAPTGENLADRIPVIVLISDFQIPRNQSISGSNYWSGSLKFQSDRFYGLYQAGILQTVRFDHLGNHTGLNSEYSTHEFDLLMENNVSPNGHSHWGFTKVNMGTAYAAALSKIKNDFIALAPPADGQGTIITDVIPEDLALVPGSISDNGAYDPSTRTITWDMSDKNAGEITVEFTVTVNQAPQDFANTAVITFPDDPGENTNTTYHRADYPTADITVAKRVTGPYADEDKSFLFTAYFKDGNGDPLDAGTEFTLEPGGGVLTVGAEGKASFNLKHDQSLTIKDVPAEYMIKITEFDYVNCIEWYEDSNSTASGPNDMDFIPVDVKNRNFDFINIMTGPEGIPVGLMKVDAEDASAGLAGAQFKVYALQCEDSGHNHLTDPTDVVDLDNPGLCWAALQEAGADQVFTSESDGSFFAGELADGFYMLAEVKAPEGFELPVGQWLMEVNASNPDTPQGGYQLHFLSRSKGAMPNAVIREALPGGGFTYKIVNARPIALPLSGSGGTVPYIIGGSLLMALSLAAVYTRKRRRWCQS